jgi:hypothetical protein
MGFSMERLGFGKGRKMHGNVFMVFFLVMVSLQIDMYDYLANAHDVISTIKIYGNTLFSCDNSLQVCRKLGLADKIDDAMLVEQAGGVVLEQLIVNQHVKNTRELILTSS